MVADEPLSLALKRNNLDCAELLLDHGADPNTRYFMGHEINLVSVLRFQAIKLLLKYGADPNARDRSGLTPLMSAARHPQGLKTVEILIEHGADVNAYATERHDYRSVLHHSIFSGSVDLIRLLLIRGANYPDMEPVDKPSPLDIAIISGRHDIVRLLCKFDAHVNGCSNTTIGQPLHTALTQRVENKHEIVKILLDYGADPNSRSTSNRHTGPPINDYLHSSRLNANSSPSMMRHQGASSNRGPDMKMVRLLLMYGAKVQLINPNASNLGLARVLERVQDEIDLDLLELLIEAAEIIDWFVMCKVIYNCLRIANRPRTNELFDPSSALDMTPEKLKDLLLKTESNHSFIHKDHSSLRETILKSMLGDKPRWSLLSLKQAARIRIRQILIDDDHDRECEMASYKGSDFIRGISALPIPFVLKKYLLYQE